MSIVAEYAPQNGLSEVVSELEEREFVLLGSDLNGHVGEQVLGYEGVHGGQSFGMKNAEGERTLEFGDALNMIVCNTMFKRSNLLITYESDGAVSQINYFLARKDRRFIRDVKVITGEVCATKLKLLVRSILFTRCSTKKKKSIHA